MIPIILPANLSLLTHEKVQYSHVYEIHQSGAMVVRRRLFHRVTVGRVLLPPESRRGWTLTSYNYVYFEMKFIHQTLTVKMFSCNVVQLLSLVAGLFVNCYVVSLAGNGFKNFIEGDASQEKFMQDFCLLWPKKKKKIHTLYTLNLSERHSCLYDIF